MNLQRWESTRAGLILSSFFYQFQSTSELQWVSTLRDVKLLNESLWSCISIALWPASCAFTEPEENFKHYEPAATDWALRLVAAVHLLQEIFVGFVSTRHSWSQEPVSFTEKIGQGLQLANYRVAELSPVLSCVGSMRGIRWGQHLGQQHWEHLPRENWGHGCFRNTGASGCGNSSLLSFSWW